MFRNSIVPITAGVMLALAGSAQAAGTRTTTFPVTATVASNCLINSASAMAFGNYDGSAAGRLDIARSPFAAARTPPYTIALNAGDAGGFAPRKLLVRRRDAGVQPVTATRVEHRCGATRVGVNTGCGTGSRPQQRAYAHGVRPALRQRGQPGCRGRRLHRHDHGHRSLLIASHALPESHGKRPRVGGSPVAAAGVGGKLLDLAAAGGALRPGDDCSTDDTQRGRRAGPRAGRDAALVAGRGRGQARAHDGPARVANRIHAAAQGLAAGAGCAEGRCGPEPGNSATA